MDITKEVPAVKQLRKEIDEIIQKVRDLQTCDETNLVITKLQEAIMWLGMNLKRLGQANPYPESKDPNSMTIHPTADGLKM